MSINITVKTYGSNNNEAQAAKDIRDSFAEELRGSNSRGNIVISSSVQLFGQKVRDLDLVILGKFSGLKVNLHSQLINQHQITLPVSELKDVEIKDFCFVVEMKDHDANDLYTDNFALYAKYKDGVRNVTDQSEEQKYALKNFITSECKGMAPRIVNLVWLRNVDSRSQLNAGNVKNLLFGRSFSFRDMLQAAVESDGRFLPFQTHSGPVLSASSISAENMDKLFNMFQQEKHRIGPVTRAKVTQITTNKIDNELMSMDETGSFMLIKGLAGTGKTSRLLRVAYKLQEEKNARCLILTYNRALVGDIKRLLAFADVSDQLDYRTVSIQTMESFFKEIMRSFSKELDLDMNGPHRKVYSEGMRRLDEYIKQNLIDENDISAKKETVPGLDWDYVLVDEAQDWSDAEKDVLMTFFRGEHLIVADGIDQIVRGTTPQNWLVGLKREDYKTEKLKESLRQKSNLANFSNSLASQLGIGWSVKLPPRGMGGGKVIITDQEFFPIRFQRYLNNCRSLGNEAYDFVILTPRTLVDRDKNGRGHFRLKSRIESECNVGVFDGTNEQTRDCYASVDQVRVYQYDSCRGLEGWTVVCLNFDEFVTLKKQDYITFNLDVENPNVMNTRQDRQMAFVKRWIMMAVTRPIDTLVITLKDPSSHIANMLRAVASEFDGGVECDFKE